MMCVTSLLSKQINKLSRLAQCLKNKSINMTHKMLLKEIYMDFKSSWAAASSTMYSAAWDDLMIWFSLWNILSSSKMNEEMMCCASCSCGGLMTSNWRNAQLAISTDIAAQHLERVHRPKYIREWKRLSYEMNYCSSCLRAAIGDCPICCDCMWCAACCFGIQVLDEYSVY